MDTDGKEGDPRVSVEFGIYHTVKEFVEKSEGFCHPFDSSSSISDDLLEAAFELLTKGPKVVALKRRATMT